MFCPKCGNEVQEGSAFCGDCGASIAGKSQGAKGADASPVSAAVAAAPVAKKASKKGPIVIVAAIVVIVTIAAIGFSLFGGSGVAVKDSTEAYTWDELSKISSEIAKASDENAAVEVAKKYNLTTSDGRLDGTQTKQLTLSDGTKTEVQIVGFAHDDKTDGGKAGISFNLYCIGEHYMNSSDTNAGGWEASQMRSYLNTEGLSLLPGDLKEKIVAVNKLTNNVGETQSTSSVTTTSDQLWLFSSTELCGSVSWYSGSDAACNDVLNAEGSEYKLFRDMNVQAGDSNIILARHLSTYWWERSPRPSSSECFLGVYSSGTPHGGVTADGSYGVVPGFCI